MLSFLYRLIRGFKSEHGFSPNIVYLSSRHYDALRNNLSDMTHEQIELFLQLHIIMEPEALHPHVAWQDPARWHQGRGLSRPLYPNALLAAEAGRHFP